MLIGLSSYTFCVWWCADFLMLFFAATNLNYLLKLKFAANQNQPIRNRP